MDSLDQNSHPALVLGEIGLIHNLGEADIPIYVGTEIRDNPSLYSRFVQKKIEFSDYTSPEFINELCDFGQTLEEKAVIFSDDDHAILNIARHQDRLKQYFLFSFPPESMVEKLLDKQRFCQLTQEFDLPAPKSITLSSLKDLQEKRVSELTYPCIIKPSFKQAWWDGDFDEKVGDYQKAIKCDSYEVLKEKYQQIEEINPHVVVQEFIEGDEDEIYSVNMCVDENSELRGYFIAQKLRTYPIRAGEGSYIKTVQDTEMIAIAMSIVDKLELKGLLNIQFKRDERTNKPVLLEVHTRNSVWSYLGTAAGVNIAKIYYKNLTDREKNTVPQYKSGVTYVFLEKDIKAFIQNLKDRQVPLFQWVRSYFQRFVVAGYQWRDPLPFFMTIGFFLRRRIKAFRTSLF